MTQPKLKPCPFCGGVASVNGWYNGEYVKPDDYLIFCSGCEASTDDYADELGAVTAWNTRTPDLSRILKLAAHAKAYYQDSHEKKKYRFYDAVHALTQEDHQLLEAVLKE